MKNKQLFELAKKIHFIRDVLYGMLLSCILIIGSITAIAGLKLQGNSRLYIVRSGSMEPALPRGSVIFTQHQSDYRAGDIVTYKESAISDNTITHRVKMVVERGGQRVYITKGDANSVEDSEVHADDLIIGKVTYAVPYIGYPVGYAKTKDGLLFLIIIPSTIIIWTELQNMKSEIVAWIRQKRFRFRT